MDVKQQRAAGRGALILWLAVVLVIGLAVILWGLNKFGKPVKAGAGAGERSVLVETLFVEAGDVEDTLVLPGRVVPATEAEVAAEKAGRVVALLADKGDAVSAGDVLMRVDDRLWRAARERAEVVWRDAERELERWQKLRPEGGISESEYASLEKARDLARIALDEAKVLESQCEATSPVNGVVEGRYVEPGEYVNEGMPVFRVVSRRPVNVVVEVPERDVLGIREGSTLDFTAAAFPGRTFEGRVSFLSPAGSRQSNAFTTELLVENADLRLRPGMIVSVELSRGVIEDAVVLPLSAIVPVRGDNVVFVVEEGRASRRVVRITTIKGDRAVLAEGVADGEEVVVAGQRGLQDGTRVKTAEGDTGS